MSFPNSPNPSGLDVGLMDMIYSQLQEHKIFQTESLENSDFTPLPSFEKLKTSRLFEEGYGNEFGGQPLSGKSERGSLDSVRSFPSDDVFSEIPAAPEDSSDSEEETQRPLWGSRQSLFEEIIVSYDEREINAMDFRLPPVYEALRIKEDANNCPALEPLSASGSSSVNMVIETPSPELSCSQLAGSSSSTSSCYNCSERADSDSSLSLNRAKNHEETCPQHVKSASEGYKEYSIGNLEKYGPRKGSYGKKQISRGNPNGDKFSSNLKAVSQSRGSGDSDIQKEEDLVKVYKDIWTFPLNRDGCRKKNVGSESKGSNVTPIGNFENESGDFSETTFNNEWTTIQNIEETYKMSPNIPSDDFLNCDSYGSELNLDISGKTQNTLYGHSKEFGGTSIGNSIALSEEDAGYVTEDSKIRCTDSDTSASSKAKVSVRPTKPKDPPHLIEFQVSLSSRQALHSFLHDSNTPTEFSLCHLASLLYSLLRSDYVNLYILNPEPLSIQESLVFNVTSRTPRQWRVLEDDIYITQAARERRTLVHVTPCQDCPHPDSISSTLCFPVSAPHLPLYGVIELGRSQSQPGWTAEHLNLVTVLAAMFSLDRQSTASKKLLQCENDVHAYMRKLTEEYKGEDLQSTIQKCLNFVKNLCSANQASMVIVYDHWLLFYGHTDDENSYVKSGVHRDTRMSDCQSDSTTSDSNPASNETLEVSSQEIIQEKVSPEHDGQKFSPHVSRISPSAYSEESSTSPGSSTNFSENSTNSSEHSTNSSGSSTNSSGSSTNSSDNVANGSDEPSSSFERENDISMMADDILMYIRKEKRCVLVNNMSHCARVKEFLEPLTENTSVFPAEPLKIKSILSVPILPQDGQVIGIISAFNKKVSGFDSLDKCMLEIIAEYFVLIIHHYVAKLDLCRMSLNYELGFGLLQLCPTREECHHERYEWKRWRLDELPEKFFSYSWYPVTSQLQDLRSYCYSMLELTFGSSRLFQSQAAQNFVQLVHTFYHDNTFHNFLQGVLSMHFVFLTVWNCQMTCGLDKIALLISSLCQYIGHSGVVSDDSILTQHHINLIQMILVKSCLFSNEITNHLRNKINHLLSSTERYSRFSSMRNCMTALTSTGVDYSNQEHRIWSQEILLNTSRLAHLCKSESICKKRLRKYFSLRSNPCECFSAMLREFLVEEDVALQFHLLSSIMPWNSELEELAKLKSIVALLKI